MDFTNLIDFLSLIFILFFLFFFYSKLLLKLTKVTTEHQKMPKMGQNRVQSPPQELEVGPCSGPYLLVIPIVVSL